MNLDRLPQQSPHRPLMPKPIEHLILHPSLDRLLLKPRQKIRKRQKTQTILLEVFLTVKGKKEYLKGSS
jgi:hypothetical protein